VVTDSESPCLRKERTDGQAGYLPLRRATRSRRPTLGRLISSTPNPRSRTAKEAARPNGTRPPGLRPPRPWPGFAAWAIASVHAAHLVSVSAAPRRALSAPAVEDGRHAHPTRVRAIRECVGGRRAIAESGLTHSLTTARAGWNPATADVTYQGAGSDRRFGNAELPDATAPELTIVPDSATPELTAEPGALPLPPMFEPAAPASEPW
jgi:hypothetical protein